MIEFYVYLAKKNVESRKGINYRRHAQLLDMSIRVNQPGGVLRVETGPSENIFVHRVRGLKKLLQKSKNPVFSVDADAILLKPLDDLFAKDFCMAFIYRADLKENGRPNDCMAPSFYNTKDRDKQIAFCEEWEKRQVELEPEIPWIYEQIAMNEIIGKCPVTRTKEEYYDCVPFDDCYRDDILFVDSLKYFCPHSLYTPDDVRVISPHHSIWPATKRGYMKLAQQMVKQ